MRKPLHMILCAFVMTSSFLINVISGDVRLYACRNSRMKFVMVIKPFEAKPNFALFNFLCW
jgi:hypothetical protein